MSFPCACNILTIPTTFLTAFRQQITRKEKRGEKNTGYSVLQNACDRKPRSAATHPHANKHPDCKMLYSEKEGSNGNGLSCESGAQQCRKRQLESGNAQLTAVSSDRRQADAQANPHSGRRLNTKQALLFFYLVYITGI